MTIVDFSIQGECRKWVLLVFTLMPFSLSGWAWRFAHWKKQLASGACRFALRKKQLAVDMPICLSKKTVGVACSSGMLKNGWSNMPTCIAKKQLLLDVHLFLLTAVGGTCYFTLRKNSCDMTMPICIAKKTVGLSIFIRKAKTTVGTGMPVWKAKKQLGVDIPICIAKKTVGVEHAHLGIEKNSWWWRFFFCETRKQGGFGHPLDARKTLRTDMPVSMARKQVGVDNAYLYCESNRLAMGMPICIANKLVSGWRSHLPDEKGYFGRTLGVPLGWGELGGWIGMGRGGREEEGHHAAIDGTAMPISPKKQQLDDRTCAFARWKIIGN